MLTIETRPIARLIPYVHNARTHSGDQIAQIAGSIAEFGFVNPVLIGADDVIIAGHGRILAAEKLGLAEVPVIVLSHLSESQRRALVITDTRNQPALGLCRLASICRRRSLGCPKRHSQPVLIPMKSGVRQALACWPGLWRRRGLVPAAMSFKSGADRCVS